MKDVIIGAITNYSIDQISPWVESINKCGFNGDRYMVCYNVSYETVDYLKKNGFKLKLFQNDTLKRVYTHPQQQNFHICVNRFYDMWNLLNDLDQSIKNDYRFIISTDVGDVIFQSNPSTWLENNLKNYKINAATESLKYKDEVLWGANNMKQSFGDEVYSMVKERLIYNAGTISGRFQTILDMFLVIYNMCQGFKTRNPDQAAYNLLLSLEPYKSITKFNMSEDGWAAQLGTTMNPSALKSFEGNIVEKLPILENEMIVTNKKKKPFVIVHQYNRLPELTLLFKNKFKV
jgi:hypothetical protein